ncbi:MAG: tautomerase family protein [Sedimenticola sp.]|nr:tautomerase family protein [Sedimenticola sp.]
MPIVTITLQAGRPSEEIRQLMESVHAALVSTLGLAPDNRNQRLIEIRPEHYFYPAGRSSDFLTIEIASFPGRSREIKAALFEKIYHNLHAALSIAAEDVMILIHEPPFENWGINGRQARNPRTQ